MAAWGCNIVRIAPTYGERDSGQHVAVAPAALIRSRLLEIELKPTVLVKKHARDPSEPFRDEFNGPLNNFKPYRDEFKLVTELAKCNKNQFKQNH